MYAMSTENESDTDTDDELPTAPCSVVWSGGHAYVLEGNRGRPRWMGVDDRGRPVSLTNDDLRRKGWSRSRTAQ
jgi:hypothetical protein